MKTTVLSPTSIAILAAALLFAPGCKSPSVTDAGGVEISALFTEKGRDCSYPHRSLVILPGGDRSRERMGRIMYFPTRSASAGCRGR